MLNLKSKKHILWDWNGTLLNDIVVCVDCMNVLLNERSLPRLTLQNYQQIFTFPVKNYYKEAGFDFTDEAFEKPALEFIRLYHKNFYKAELFPCVEEVLNFMKNAGLRQSVLSAMEHESLIQSLKDKGIYNYFDEVSGIDNHYADSKLEIGQELIKRIGSPVNDMLIIGDSLHDFDVAGKLGVDCVLVANGHQSKERILSEAQHVLDELKDILPFFA